MYQVGTQRRAAVIACQTNDQRQQEDKAWYGCLNAVHLGLANATEAGLEHLIDACRVADLERARPS
ncbi:hypothetical protein [Deinococcus ruber]|uniref:hypothetical protein n=1 Tax=Deinococcus ruber TaxID=1848197 RepID=UPI0016679E9C|nr:hypothetical protein [Deinococcus ruber]